jgi:dihydrofolate reductase
MNDLTLIVAMTPSGLIGVDGKIPWHIPEDMRRFKQLTTGHAIIMGRKTWDSIGRPLPNRMNIVVSRGVIAGPKDSLKPGTTFHVSKDPDEALNSAYESDPSPFVIGGAEIYKHFLPLATKLEVTFVVRDIVRDEPPYETLTFVDLGLPSMMWDWRCTAAVRATEHEDVEFYTFERRRAVT